MANINENVKRQLIVGDLKGGQLCSYQRVAATVNDELQQAKKTELPLVDTVLNTVLRRLNKDCGGEVA